MTRYDKRRQSQDNHKTRQDKTITRESQGKTTTRQSQDNQKTRKDKTRLD